MQVGSVAVDATGLDGVAAGTQFECLLHRLLACLFRRAGRSRWALARAGGQGHGSNKKQMKGAHGGQDNGRTQRGAATGGRSPITGHMPE